jgi:hypothetical protein
MGKKLFAGGLAWATSDDGLSKAFEKYGAVKEAKWSAIETQGGQEDSVL